MGLLKALLLASQGVEPVEANADFIAEVAAVAGDALMHYRWCGQCANSKTEPSANVLCGHERYHGMHSAPSHHGTRHLCRCTAA